MRRRCGALVVGVCLTSAAARADDATPPPTLVPPRLVDSPPPTYPAGAAGDAEIVCEVLVAVDGSVQEAKVVAEPRRAPAGLEAGAGFASDRVAALRSRTLEAGAGSASVRVAALRSPTLEAGAGFASDRVAALRSRTLEAGAGSASDRVAALRSRTLEAAALAAVRAYRFEPATRSGLPVRARVRVAVTFTAPRRAAAAVARVPAPQPAANAAPVEEVRVRGTRHETRSATERRMGRAEIRMLPGAFGDPFRALDIMPGVVPTISGLPYYYVRGAPPSAVGYYIDEVRVPYLFHFGLGPGVIQPALVNEVALHPAAYPARFGRYAGGVIAGETGAPSPTFRAESLVRLFDAGAFVETPLGGRVDVAVGGRYSYTGLLLSLFSPKVQVRYQDYNARISVKLNDRTRFTAFAFGAYDYAAQIETGKPKQVVFASEFHRLDLRLDHTTDQSHSRLAVTLGLDRTRLESTRFARDEVLGIRGRHRVALSRALEVEAGADLQIDFHDGDKPNLYSVTREEYAAQSELYSPRTDTGSGAWLSALLRPGLGTEFVATARADVFTSAGKMALGPSPRFTARLPLHERVTALLALAVAEQPPAFAIPLPAVGYRGLPGGLSVAYQKSAGIDVRLPLDFTANATGFHHSYRNFRDVLQQRNDLDLDRLDARSHPAGQAFGLELLVRRKLVRRVSATLSYTLSRSELGSTERRAASVSSFDRTHVLQAASTVDLSHGWYAGARTVFYTGWKNLQRTDLKRLPPFFRVDVRLEKRWTWRTTGHVSLLFEGLNVTASKEILSQTCDAQGTCTSQKFGPVIVPSIGGRGRSVSVRFVACSLLLGLACVPSTNDLDPHGAAGFELQPSATTTGQPLDTVDGYRVTVDHFVANVLVFAETAASRDAGDYDGTSQQTLLDVAHPEPCYSPGVGAGRALLRFSYASSAVPPTRDLDPVVQAAAASYLDRFRRPADVGEIVIVNDVTAPFGPSIALAVHAVGHGHTYDFDLTFDATGGFSFDPEPSVEVTGNALATTPLEADVELMFYHPTGALTYGPPDLAAGPQFADFAAADADGDGHLTAAEISAPRNGAPSLGYALVQRTGYVFRTPGSSFESQP